MATLNVETARGKEEEEEELVEGMKKRKVMIMGISETCIQVNIYKNIHGN